ncbi:MAG: NCS1 family nucleobase:cation symporter-1 [Candidatus Obscuribacterales bacterium]|nr:NCS1 family nucleobase:cation symporter-1 [Candidatus Obscuribacterales bacterium]
MKDAREDGAPTIKELLEVIEHSDGRVDLRHETAISASPLYNHDLAPVPVAARKWSTYNYAALWVSMSACIPTYMLSSGLIASGMNWWQALVTILLGNIIVLAPILLNSHPGTKYGVPFPVFARAAYGTYGSNLPALMRALVACGWFGIQSWIGGQALNTFFAALIPNWATLLGAPILEHAPTAWLSFGLFWGFNIFIIYKGMDLLKKVEGLAAPFVMTMTVLLCLWAVISAHGLGALISQPSKFKTTQEFLITFFPSLTAMVGYWATLSLNMPDFTRFGHSQREQTIGQVIALPTAMTLFSAMSVIITSAAITLYPSVPMTVLWDPVQLIGQFKEPLVVAISMFTVAVATLSVNIAANVVSPANDFANAFPKFITFKTGGLITGIIGIAMQPWKLVADPSGYIFQWLVGYSGGLGSIAGVLIVDYWIIRRCHLELADLYLVDSSYQYTKGWNLIAVVATIIGCACAWCGAFIPQLKGFYDNAWFVGLLVSGSLYWAMMTFRGKTKQVASE